MQLRLQVGPYNRDVADANFLAFRDALTAGGMIEIPEGVYHIRTPETGERLVIGASGTSLIGTGNTTLIFSRWAVGSKFGGILSEGRDDITIRGIKFQGTRTDGEPNRDRWGRGPEFLGGNNILIENCTFSSFLPHNLSFGRIQTPGGEWIIDGNPNSTASVQALRHLLARNVIVRGNTFRYPNGAGLSVFGAEDVRIENNTFEFSDPPEFFPYDECDKSKLPIGGGIAILLDDASQRTKLKDYSFNINVNVWNNYSPWGRLRFDGTASGTILNNHFMTIEIRSYDFDQQFINMQDEPKPFLHM